MFKREVIVLILCIRHGDECMEKSSGEDAHNEDVEKSSLKKDDETPKGSMEKEDECLEESEEEDEHLAEHPKR